MEAGREVWHFMATSNLLGCSTAGQGEQQQRPSYGVPVEQKWRQSACKAGQKAVLGEPFYPPGSGVGTEGVDNHHHSHSGHF